LGITNIKIDLPNYVLLNGSSRVESRQVRKPINLYVNITITVILWIAIQNRQFNNLIQFKILPKTPVDSLVNAVDVLFPKCLNSSNVNQSSFQDRGKNAISINGRPDIQSFAYDLGGTTCACQLKWSPSQYWQRVFYGPKYVLGHTYTAFAAVFFLYDWKYVIVWKYLNEILEELALTVYSRWAGDGGEPVSNLESRYDTMINDLLGGAVFILLGSYCVHVLEIKDDFTIHINEWYGDIYWGWKSFFKTTLTFLQFWVFTDTARFMHIFGMKKTPIGGAYVDFAIIVTLTAQILLVQLFAYMNAWEFKKTSLFCGCLTLVFIPFIFDSFHLSLTSKIPSEYHQISALLAFVITAAPLICYDYFYNVFYTRIFLMSGITIAIFILWLRIENIVKTPENQFYSHANWCGLSALDTQHTTSCANVIL
tara:strand:+ start:56 stop:1327 length:1272 start_codon:yes stop_codon:yes gene_type:complete